VGAVGWGHALLDQKVRAVGSGVVLDRGFADYFVDVLIEFEALLHFHA
jgi:hypothetical protein